ncbi:vanadium-dependent haloperoxidase [Micromonospora sp. NPDC126480]|uniref:vanadium-dependent haloperoxidase n=1 Tax=Micromonospora sp. NPDC126480 TaxID=3155312 RepID=UPI00332822F8
MSDPVLHWSAVAEPVVAAGRPPASAAVLAGIVHAAIHDAAVAGFGRYPHLFAAPRSRHRADLDAAVATAAYRVLAERVPAQADHLAGEYAAHLALLGGGPAVQRGIELGGVVAEAVIAARRDDGLDANVPWVQPAPGPGVFEPVATRPDGSPATPVDVQLGQVRPLVLRTPHQVRPTGAAELTSRRYAVDLDEVATYGRLDSPVRSARQTETARFWAENAFTHWSRNLRRLATDQALTPLAAARMLAVAHVASADAVIACFEAKYHYLFWRPLHAITRADTDANPATQPDLSWRSLLTVNHPEYPSAHATWSHAVAHGLGSYFGPRPVQLVMDSTATGTTRSYPRISAVAREVGEARILAGLHFRFSVRDGAVLGRSVADLVARRLGWC